jgi:hypothetical protein
MRRFALLQVTEDKESQSGSLFWRSVCGGADDVWEVFQVYRGIVPTLAQVQGSAAVLISGGVAGAPGLITAHRDALFALLPRIASDSSLRVIAAGSGAQVSGRNAVSDI